MIRTLKFAVLALFIAVSGISLTTAPSFAVSHWPSYRIAVVNQTIHAGHDVVISIRLVRGHHYNPDDDQPVLNASIAEAKLEMLMEGMAPMAAKVKALTPDANGNYRVACDVTEPGDWQLDLSLQVPDESEPVHGTLKFHVVP